MKVELLKKSGYKITKSRELVVDYLTNKKQPLSALDIYQGLRGQLDKVTVYRILEVLEKVGIVFKEQIDNQSTYYLADKQHHHVICRNCGVTQCLPCEHIFKQIKGFKQIQHQLTLTGICTNCDSH